MNLSQNKSDSADADDVSGIDGFLLKILGQTACPIEPGKRPFNEPAFGLDHKLPCDFAGKLNLAAMNLGHKLLKKPSVTQVSQHFLHLFLLPQNDIGEHRIPLGIVNIGPMHQHLMEISLRVNGDLALASFDFPPRQSRVVGLFQPFSHFAHR